MTSDNIATAIFVAIVVLWTASEPSTLRSLSTVGRTRGELVRQSSWLRSIFGTVGAGVAFFFQPHWFVLENQWTFLGVITLMPFVLFRINRAIYSLWLMQPDTEQDALENAEALRRTGAVGENVLWPVFIREAGKPKDKAIRAETRSEVGQVLVDWNHKGAPVGKEWELRDAANRLLVGEVVKGRVIYLMLARSAQVKAKEPPP